ncbi:MAG: polymerase, sigma 70 subunit, RpoD subfamily [Chloroflexi bacterium]|nr:polymerase, sigma 70 subunit, RpoD subfamily [Chloroflexota bacterium]
MALAAAIAAGRLAHARLDEAGIDSAERTLLSEEIEAGCAAREELFLANLRLALHLARQFQNRGLPLADLVQEANMGLFTAVDRFDHTLGNHFSTYAFWWIRQALSRAVAERGRLIRLPPHVGDTLRDIERARSALATEGLEPTVPALAARTGNKPEKVEMILRAWAFPASLDDGPGEGEFIPDAGALDVEDEVAEQINSKALHAALQSMPPREQHVIARHFGLDGDKPAKLAEVARTLGLSRERVRQIEVAAFDKLRQFPSIRALRVDAEDGLASRRP